MHKQAGIVWHVIVRPCIAFVVFEEDGAQDLGLHRQAPTTGHRHRPLIAFG